MSEQEFSQDEERVESREAQESSEVVEGRDLEQATSEPEALVETSRDYQEAEQIEAVVVDLVDAVEVESQEEFVQEVSSTAGEVESTDLSQSREVSRTVTETEEETAREVEIEQATRETQAETRETETESAGEAIPVEVIDTALEGAESENIAVVEEVIEVEADTGPIEESLSGEMVNVGVVAGLEEVAEDATGMEETVEFSEEGMLNQDTISEEALEGVEEYWEPPEMYVHHGQDGTTTIVGPDGKPLDSPPIIQKIVDGSGKEQVIAYYPGMDTSSYFNIESYDKPVDASSTYVHIDSAGKPVVVDSTGKPIDSPPMIQMFVDSSGKEVYQAQYPGTTQTQNVELQAYVGGFEKELYVHVGADGTRTVVDASGKPIDSPPQINIFLDSSGQEVYKASYPGGGEESKAILSSYTAPLEGCFVHYGQDGKLTVVDAAGKPINSPPALTKMIDGKSQEVIVAQYPGTSQEGKVTLQAYQPTQVQETFISFGSDGKPIVVDASGKPIDSPPKITIVMGTNATPVYKAFYPGHETETQTTLSTYSAPLDDCYIHVGQDGKATVVGADGKPLDTQPTIHKIVDSTGTEIITAWYQAGTGLEQKYQLGYYKPPSGA